MDTVFITGVSKGLGKALAEKYYSQGYYVIGISRTAIDFFKQNATFIQGDVTDAHIIDLIKQKTDGVLRIDIVINNAGAGSFGHKISDVNPEEVLYQVNLHCIGALRVAKAVYPLLIKSQNPKIINITSRLGSIQQHLRGDFKSRNEFSYGYKIGKGAQNMLSICMQNDPDLKKVIIMSVNPGLLLTDSGASDAEHTAEDGAEKIYNLIKHTNKSGIYHAFKGEALY